MKKKLPSFQFYPGDWMKDPQLRLCSPGARGIWIDLLCLMFESEQRGVLRINGRAIKLSEMRQFLNGFRSKFVQELIQNGVMKAARKDGAFYSKRLVRDELKRRHKARNGQLGGKHSQAKPKQTGSKHQANGQANQGSSTSTSTSTSTSVKKNIYIVPKLADVIVYFLENSNTESEANKFYDYFSLAGWHDSKGRKVMYWKRNAATWLSNNKPKVKTKAELLAEAEATPRKNRTWDQTLMLMKAAGSKELAEHPERYEVEL